MALGTVMLGHLKVSKLIIGGNPFSGFSHQSMQKDLEMKRYFTTERIKETLKAAEKLGINTHLGRADHHVMRILLEYWDEGGTIQWFGQTCSELGSPLKGIENAIAGGAKACYVHGGQMDNLLANNQLDQVKGFIDRIKAAGLAAGVAGHNPKVFEWAEKNLNVDFYMCSYYDPIPRTAGADHVAGTEEKFKAEDRDAMVRMIKSLSKPAIHYKVMAAGRHTPEEALRFVARHLRPQDAVCVGIFAKDKPDMIAEDIRLLEEYLAGK